MTNIYSVYRWVISFLRPYKLLVAGLVLAMGIAACVELAIPKLIQYFIDDIVPEKDSGSFKWLVALLTSLIVILISLAMARNLLQRHVQEKASRDMQLSIFRHLRALGVAYYEKHPAGETLAFLNTEVASIQRLYRELFPSMIFSFLFSMVAFGVMVWSSWQLTLVAIPFFALYYLYGPAIERRAAVAGNSLAGARIAANQKAHESVSAIRELRLFTAEKWDLRRYLEKVDAWNAQVVKAFFLSYLRGSGRMFSYYAGALGLFVIGSWLLQKNLLTAGEFVGFLLLYFVSMQQLTRLIAVLTEQRVIMHQAHRLYQFVHTESEVKEPVEGRIKLHNPVRGDIRFDDVHYSYSPELPVLRGLQLTVKAGERVALVGESGNGKSTILKLIGRFYDPQQGTITLDGIPTQRLSFEDLRNPLGFVFQETYLFGHTVRENILFGRPDASEQEVVNAAKAAYAHDFIMKLPEQYDTNIGERGVKLSGGQRQRIAIARMFIKEPVVILLDEATSALDTGSEREVQRALDKLMQGRTVIAVAHRLSTIENFDRVVVIEDGKVVEQGSYAQLSQSNGAFQRLLTGQV